TGAGPYPQTYFDSDDPQLKIEAEKKKRAFFERYRSMTTALAARLNMPFAGKYLLGGKLVGLNEYRGVADAVEVLEIDPRAVVLADAGGEINTADLVPTKVRTSPYQKAELDAAYRRIAPFKLDYERLVPVEETHQLPLKRLLAAAVRKAVARSECDVDYF